MHCGGAVACCRRTRDHSASAFCLFVNYPATEFAHARLALLYTAGQPVTVAIVGYPGHTYQLQKSNALGSAPFATITGVPTQSVPSSASNPTTLTFTDNNPSAGSGFYRVAVDP